MSAAGLCVQSKKKDEADSSDVTVCNALQALDRQADVNETNDQGFTVLMVACSLGLVDVVELLLRAGMAECARGRVR